MYTILNCSTNHMWNTDSGAEAYITDDFGTLQPANLSAVLFALQPEGV